ncbi:SusD/RagB family nutrient-binding outer membrane lipoprotein [Mangrovibacterium lignilyticum]|uniref:SusD/RagB family nutrient-binding outer membrane lipoprotein n=1 Tax=Mangrovibacterium lignilyticum TaxID=2668052 RepID=UPI0013D1AB5E|nr:SusD/RagB family nutrient-binding outer membrane lipoprotein [Mangrovibacterium lignilyticum]
MKKITTIFIILLGLIVSSCDYDLDINTSPNNSQVASPELRLPYILTEACDFYGSHGTRVAAICQQMGYVYSPSARYYQLENWQFANNADAWVWQCWYGYAWVNIDEMVQDAEDMGAWHYVGVGKILEAFGNGALVDAYGYIAYQDGLSGNIQPDYDDAEYVYSQVLPLVDEGIADLQKAQNDGAPDLSAGDIMYNGDVDKWIKFGYGVKARLMSHLSKKSVGTGLLDYNPDAILDLLQMSFTSNDDDAEYKYEESDISARRAIQYSNMSSSYKPGKLWIDYLLNTVEGSGNSWNSGVEDPRAEKLIPRILEGDNTGQYSFGIDLTIANTDPQSSDVNYVGLRSTDENQLFYTQQSSSYFLMTYAEAKFIEAEVYFREGDKANALTAYQAAIAANMDKLGVAATDRDAFLASEAVAQTAADLTLSHIMIQKYITLTYSPEVWTDMRRCDYCIGSDGTYNLEEGVYKGFKRPEFAYETAFPTETDYIRRYQMAYYERYYNAAKVTDLGVFENSYMTEPVWWDIAN